MKDAAEEIVTLRGKAHEVILKYLHRWPKIATNYTLIGLLIMRDYDGLVVSWSDLGRASRGELSNLSSLQRAIADARKPFLTEEEERTMRDREEKVHDLFARDKRGDDWF